MKVAMLTGGGDCPGLNAVIRAVVRKGQNHYGDELVGFRDGWRGAIEGDTVPLDVEAMRGTLPRGGTVIGSSRTNPYKVDGGPERVAETVKALGIDALIAIGGEDTLGVASKLTADGLVPVVGVPKTIDNDLSATELTFGFDTAVQICVDAIDRLHTTAESHDRVIVVEVMGRHAGHIAVWSGIAGGAAMVLIPEERFDIEAVCEALRHRHENRNRYASIVVVAEGALPTDSDSFHTQTGELDEFGHVRLGGIGDALAKEIEERTGYESRAVVLGHVQRGGTPTAFDRVLSTRFGVAAIDAVHDGAFGTMVALQAGDIVQVPIEEATGTLKLVDPELYDVAKVFFGVTDGLFSADPANASPLIPAATVLLLRDTAGGMEVLMLRKNRGQAFGGKWVFPGGKVDAVDHDPSTDAVDDPDAAELAVARRAAERETLEETGLVLADADFVPFSHWVPPPETPKRFSTWFFAAALPAGAADVIIDGGEIGDHVWTTPAGALDRHAAGEAELVPPTWVTLADLAGCATTGDAIALARSREVPRYRTRFVSVGGTVVTLWHPDASYGTEPLDLDAPGPRHRLHMHAGGWVLERS